MPPQFYGAVTAESILVFIILIFGTFVFGNLIYLILRELTRNRFTQSLSKVSSRLVSYAIYTLGLYIGVSQVLGINLTTAVAALGIAGILIAISSQQILQNIFAGILLAIERPIKIGDWIEVGGIPQAGLCRVRDITLRRTILRSVNGNIVVVANSTLVTGNIVNYTQGEFLRVPVKMTVPVSADLEKIRSIILNVCKKDEKILPNVPKKERTTVLKFVRIPSLKRILEKPMEYSMFQPSINVKEISDSKMTLEILVWIWQVDNREAITSNLLEKILGEMKREKIKFT